MFGIEGIARMLKEHGEESLQELIYRLVSASSEITHGEQKDDIAVIIAQRPSI